MRRPSFDAVAGWGCKPTSQGARRLAEMTGRPYVSIEDGWLRSIRPGASELPLSLVIDTTGTHYSASRPSDLEGLVARSAVNSRPMQMARARAGISLLRDNALSKYNCAPRLTKAQMGLGPRPAGGRVLVVDQTFGDASIAGGSASAETFALMLRAARVENPDAEIVVKAHPEVVRGGKSGYLGGLDSPRVRVISRLVNPWSLLEHVDKVYVVSSQLGFEALMAGIPVTCFGEAYYAGWGLTDDRVAIERRTARPTLEQLFAALYLDYARYVCPFTGRTMAFEDAVEMLTNMRDRTEARVRVLSSAGRLPLGKPAVATVPQLSAA